MLFRVAMPMAVRPPFRMMVTGAGMIRVFGLSIAVKAEEKVNRAGPMLAQLQCARTRHGDEEGQKDGASGLHFGSFLDVHHPVVKHPGR